jgi:hypothetical protein
MQFRNFYQEALSLVWYHFTEDDNHNEAGKDTNLNVCCGQNDPSDIRRLDD